MQDKYYFQITDPRTGKRLKIELLPNDLTPQLAPLFEKHSQWLSKHYNTVAPEFLEIKEGINTWLVNKYKINPTTKAFTHWFIVNRLDPATIKIDFKLDKATGEFLPNVKVRFNFPDIETTYTPAVIEKDLHEFCHWKQQQQEGLHTLVISAQEKSTIGTPKDFMPKDHTVKAIVQNIEGYKDHVFKMIPDEGKQRFYIAQLDEIIHNLKENYSNIEIDQLQVNFIENSDIHRIKSTGLLDEFLNFSMRMIDQNLQNNPEDAEKSLQMIKRERLINNSMHTPLTRIEELLKTYQEELAHINKKVFPQSAPTSNSRKPEPISYVWQGNPEGIETLYSQLIIGGYLPASTRIENFKALFAGKQLNSITPLQWLKQKNLLVYLIDELYNMNKLPADTNYWSIAEACFTDTKNLKQIKINYLNNKNQSKPKGFEKIDIILEEIK